MLLQSSQRLLVLLSLRCWLGHLQTVSGWGNFKSYNNEEREKYLQESCRTPPEENTRGKRSVSSGKLRYDPNWEDLDSRPLPEWYDQSKIGIFIHWGVYSVPGVESEWFWKTWTDGRPECVEFMEAGYKPGFTYQEFAPEFAAEFFNVSAWAQLFVKSGAKYVVFTSKHHEGYTMWPSLYSFSWNSKDVGPHRDIVGELAQEIRTNTSLRFGLYHSLYEWYNPLWMRDKANNFSTSEFINFKIMPEMYEVVNTYRPDIFWSDGEWEAPDKYWRSEEFIAWLYNDSPVKDTVVTNDRWGDNTLCTHGGFYTCTDRYNPGVLQPHKWENCLTLDKEWGFRRKANIEDYLTPERLMTTIVESVACGGNVLVNVGPNRDGMIPPIQQQKLLEMGYWLGINGEAIFNSKPWTLQNDTVTPGVWFTTNTEETKIYAMVTSWPGQSIQLGAIDFVPSLTVSMLGTEGLLPYFQAPQGITVLFPRPDNNTSKWVWTIVINKPQQDQGV